MKIASYLTILFIFATLTTVSGQQVYNKKEPLAHTYSIVARDSATGQMAVAVQSHWFSVGSLVAWGKSGVGVVATQSFVNPAYGPQGIAKMESGLNAAKTLSDLLANDEGREVRQVAMLDAKGGVAAHTGANCISHAGHLEGKGYSVQANMMLSEVVPEAMANAYEHNAGMRFAERVVSALLAAQDAGGDIRGQQSAALIVVSGNKRDPWNDKIIELRVEDHPEPLKELVRLLKVHRAYEHMNRGDLEVEKGNMVKAMKEYGAAERILPDNLEMKFWTAVTMANSGNIDGASKILYTVFSDQQYGQNWRKLLMRLPDAGLLTLEEDDLAKLTSIGN